MRKFSLQNKIDMAFALAALLFLSLCFAIFTFAARVRANREVILETNNVNAILEKILTSTINIETGARGYVITGKESYLNAYNAGKDDVDTWMDSLRSMADDKANLRKIDSLHRLVHKKEVINALVVDTRRRRGVGHAEEIVNSGGGKQVMDSIRTFIQKYQNEQLNLLSEKLRETDDSVRLRDRLFVVLLILGFIVGFIAYVRIRKITMQTVRSEHLQRKLSHKMAMQNRQLNDFANITSHNLRSPAANIASLVDIIHEGSSIEDYRTVHEMLRKVSVNLNDTLNELIEVLHIKKNTTIEKEELSFSEAFTQVAENLQGQIIGKQAEITTDFAQAPTVRFPKIYLESILQNLLSNALKYSSPDRRPRIHISSSLLSHHVRLCVADNGLGIDLSKYGHKIFGMNQIFHRNDDAKGIGLFMTKTQVEALGGKISVESDGESGCTFIVQFPL